MQKSMTNANSDIDIAVVLDEIPDNDLNTMAMLWKLIRSVDHAVELVLLAARDDTSGFLQAV